jgi:hypothetical protein
MSQLRAYAVVLVLASTACSAEDAFRRFTPVDADNRARAYLALFTAGRVDSARTRLVPQLAGPKADEELARIGTILTGQQFDSTRVIGAQTNVIDGVRHVNLTYELHSARGWSIANVATIDSAGSWFIEGVSARTIDRPLEELTQFGLRGKTTRHYLWLVLTILAAVISISTACWIGTRREMPRRWRWVFASLLGVGAFSINWASGEIGVRLFNIQFASAAALRAAPVAPWILTFAIPVGALGALLRYRRWRTTTLAPVVQSTV